MVLTRDQHAGEAIVRQKMEISVGSRVQLIPENRVAEVYRLDARGETFMVGLIFQDTKKATTYVRQRGFEPLQQEQMVLQYVQKHSSISRSEAAELCRFNPMQAYRLLKRLEKKGQLRRIGGSTKAVRYGMASK